MIFTWGCPPRRDLVPQPGTALLFLLLSPLLFIRLELLLGEGLAAALRLETAAVMAVGGGIHVEEGAHLPAALILIIVYFWVELLVLEAACEAVEVSRGHIGGLTRVCKTSDGSIRSILLFFLQLLGLFGVVCIRVIAAVDGWVVSAGKAFGRRRSARGA